MTITKYTALTIILLLSLGLAAQPSAQTRPDYGPDITVEAARKIATAAVAACKANNWKVAVAIVNTHGSLVYYERMDNTQSASARVAVDKASAAAMYRRSTREFAEAVAGGNPAMMSLPGVIALPGGLPVLSGDKIIGGIGVSGVTADQDEQCARAGLAAM
ncbi:GlcG/HbpS family heme-binding protein [Methylobacillus flagellatus]|uniref:GlcG/HbpS family heme-binding protein n=1 Tax=Methylobacillus flagellatus TaxID=405 RepID=UPI0010F4CC9A|nr:heme-binding protein [Methylobacillus flagellatus]